MPRLIGTALTAMVFCVGCGLGGRGPEANDPASTNAGLAAVSVGLGLTEDVGQKTSHLDLTESSSYFVFCDWGSSDLHVEVTGGPGICTFDGWLGSGTMAGFACASTTPLLPGTYTPTCHASRGASLPRATAAGTVTVSAAPPSCAAPVPLSVGLGTGRNPATAGSTLSIATDALFSVFCDYGRTDLALSVIGAPAGCTFDGWVGTAGRFECSSSSTPGTWHPVCHVTGSPSVCETDTVAGALVVAASRQCASPALVAAGLSSSSSSATGAASLTIAPGDDFYALCDFGRSDLTLALSGAPGTCSFEGWAGPTGTTGRMHCTNIAPSMTGVYQPTCNVAGSAQICGLSAPVGTLTVQPRACSSPTLESAGLSAGSAVSTASPSLIIQTGSDFYAFCDFGRSDLSITLSGAPGPCASPDWLGTTARFRCSGNTTGVAGTYQPTCNVTSSALVCAASLPVGTLTLQAPQVCSPPSPAGGGLSASSAAAGMTSSLTVATDTAFYAFCDFGRTDLGLSVISAPAACTFDAWTGATGTTARFWCAGTANPGTYNLACNVSPTAQVCATSQYLGPVTVQAPLSCTNPALSYSGFSTGSSVLGSSPNLTLDTGLDYFVFCNFGRTDLNVVVSGAPGPCSASGLVGNAYRFYCPASGNQLAGTYRPTCNVSSNAQVCAASLPVGTLTLQTPTCTTPTLRSAGFSTAATPPGSSSLTARVGSDYYLFCDWGRTDLDIVVSGAPGPCSFDSWSGTTARFSCSASTTGSFTPTCNVGGGGQICGTYGYVGNLSISP